MKTNDLILSIVGIIAIVFVFTLASKVGVEREKTKQALIDKCAEG